MPAAFGVDRDAGAISASMSRSHATMTAAPGRADEVIDLLRHAPARPDASFFVSRSASEENTVHVTELEQP